MRDILAELETWQSEREDIALATVVGVRGSSPRSPGAHLGMTRAGKMAGSVSAGCVESDVYRRALEVLEGGAPLVATFSVSHAPELGVGLSCGGAVDVLIERFGDAGVWRAVRDATSKAHPVVLAVAIEPAALLGCRIAVVGAGGQDAGGTEVVGSIDAELDDAVVGEALRLLDQGGTHVGRFPLAGGAAVVFFEAILPAQRLILIGATDTARALARLAKVLGLEVVVIDARAAYARHERVPDADELVCAWPSEVLAERIDARTSVVTLAHDPKLDVPALACALRSPAAYVGALGSRRTHEVRKQALRDMKFSDTDLARIHSPVGLDLGGRTSEEIALAILAEIVAVKHGREAARLTSRPERKENGAS